MTLHPTRYSDESQEEIVEHHFFFQGPNQTNYLELYLFRFDDEYRFTYAIANGTEAVSKSTADVEEAWNDLHHWLTN